MNTQSILARRQGIVSLRQHDELILLDSGSDFRHQLNKTAAMVWQLCNGIASVSEIVDAISALCPDNRFAVEQDVFDILTNFVALELVADYVENSAPVRLSFEKLWGHSESFDIYLSQLLPLMNSMEVQANDQADIVFSSTPDLGDGNVRQVYFDVTGATQDVSTSELVVSSLLAAADGGYLRLPEWATLIDWSNNQSAELVSIKKLYLSRIALLDRKRTGLVAVFANEHNDRLQAVAEQLFIQEENNQVISITPETSHQDCMAYLQECRFCLIDDQDGVPGFGSKKLLQALAAGTVPIYYGYPEIDQEFNTQAFINGHEFASLSELGEHVRQVADDAQLYNAYLSEPIFNSGHKLYAYHPYRFAERLRKKLAIEGRTELVSGGETQTQQQPPAKLTIGMATYDDFDGVYFSVQSLRFHHPEVADQLEIIVLDNNPDGEYSEGLKMLTAWVDNYRYIPNRAINGTAVRDLIFREATADYVLCMDSHVLLEAGAIKRLIDYFDANPDTNDLLQGPLLLDDLKHNYSHFKPEWRGGMYGTWGSDERALSADLPAFEIPMQGLGLFACRRAAWRGFNPRFYGFGGEEGYIHEKFRQAGHRTLCLPFLRWLHRFHRPTGTKYANTFADRIRNYLIGFDELSWDINQVKQHFQGLIDASLLQEIVTDYELEKSSPFFQFDAIYCINKDGDTERWQKMQAVLVALGIDKRVRRFNAIETPGFHQVGNALSHRTIIAQAKKQGLSSILVLEDDAAFIQQAALLLQNSLNALQQQDWRVLHLGGFDWRKPLQSPAKSEAIACIGQNTPATSHALIYHQRVYDQILQDIPADSQAMTNWADENNSYGHYLSQLLNSFVTQPFIAMPPDLLSLEGEASRARYPL